MLFSLTVKQWINPFWGYIPNGVFIRCDPYCIHVYALSTLPDQRLLSLQNLTISLARYLVCQKPVSSRNSIAVESAYNCLQLMQAIPFISRQETHPCVKRYVSSNTHLNSNRVSIQNSLYTNCTPDCARLYFYQLLNPLWEQQIVISPQLISA